MTKINGFTIIELLITISMMIILLGSIFFVYLTSFKAFNASEDRSQTRTQLSQAMDIMTRNIYNAQSITACNATTLTFNANLSGSGAATYSYTYNPSNNILYGTSGATIASGIKPQSTVVNWGTTPALFSCSNGVVTIDMTAVNYGETIHLRSNVRTRNMPVGLVGWWRFDDVFPTVSGACSTVLDYSGNSNTGTCVNSPTWTTGNTSGIGALSFSGSNKYVNAGSNINPGNLTVSGWINISSFSPYTHQGFVDKEGQYGIYLEANKIEFDLSYSWNGAQYAATAITPGTWYLITVTFDGTYQRIYCNGVLLKSFTMPGSISTNGSIVAIGETSGGSGYEFTGSMDNVRIYNRALSANEIAQIYNGG